MLPSLVATGASEAATVLASLPVLQPPSPYHPKVRRQSAAHATVLPALFHAKMDSQLRRRPVQHVMERAERKLRASARRPQLERGQASALETAGATAQSALPRLVVADGDELGVAARSVTGRRTASMSLYRLQDSQRQEFGAWERQARQELMAQAELDFTRCTVAFLRELQLVVAREEEEQRAAAAAAAVMADAARRAEAREAYMNAIAAAAQRQVSERHTAERLHAKMTALLPAHAAGREQIVADEAAALRELLEYDRKHHPRGPGCFAIVRDHSCKGDHTAAAGKAKRGGHRSTGALVVAKSRKKGAEVTATQSHLQKLRQRSYELSEWLGEDDVMRDATVDEEMSYAAEGRTLFQREKERQAEAYRRTHAVRDLLADEVSARTALRLRESQEWMPLLARAVDGVYEAAQRTRRRLAREAAEREQAAATLVDDVLRAALKARMCRQHREEQQRAYDAEEEQAKKATSETAVGAPTPANHAVDVEPTTTAEKPRFAALDLVMRVAMADSTVSTLHNNAFASLAAAECMIGDAEHTPVSVVARQFAAAQSTSLTPAYLGAALWHTDLDETLVLSQLSLPPRAAPRHDATALRAFLRELCAARMRLVREQMNDVLTLYKRAAVERAALTAARHRASA